MPFKSLLFRHHRRRRPRKSGGPSLFQPSLKVQRDVAHYPPPGSRSCPGTTALNALGAKKVRNSARGESASDAHAMAEIDRQLWSPQTKLARAAFLESRRGKSAIRVCDRGSEPAGQALEDRPVLSRQSLQIANGIQPITGQGSAAIFGPAARLNDRLIVPAHPRHDLPSGNVCCSS